VQVVAELPLLYAHGRRSNLPTRQAMTIRTPHEIWTDCCRATTDMHAQHGPDAAIDYLICDKLMAIAQMGETHPEFLAKLPPLSARIRDLFDRTDIEAHFARADDASRVEPDLLKFATAEETRR